LNFRGPYFEFSRLERVKSSDAQTIAASLMDVLLVAAPDEMSINKTVA
jgi:hypothetical protein